MVLFYFYKSPFFKKQNVITHTKKAFGKIEESIESKHLARCQCKALKNAGIPKNPGWSIAKKNYLDYS